MVCDVADCPEKTRFDKCTESCSRGGGSVNVKVAGKDFALRGIVKKVLYGAVKIQRIVKQVEHSEHRMPACEENGVHAELCPDHRGGVVSSQREGQEEGGQREHGVERDKRDLIPDEVDAKGFPKGEEVEESVEIMQKADEAEDFVQIVGVVIGEEFRHF